MSFGHKKDPKITHNPFIYNTTTAYLINSLRPSDEYMR